MLLELAPNVTNGNDCLQKGNLQGHLRDQPKQHDVSFAVKNSLTAAIIPPSEGTERILSLGLSTSSGLVQVLSVYAPTHISTPDEKGTF